MMIDAMIETIPDDNSKFRNVVPGEIEDFVRECQAGRWDKQC